ncbi:MAG: M48 family metallopeptidase [Planctomycetota bacterium]
MLETGACQGGVRDPSLPQGRAGAEIDRLGSELVATTSSQRRFGLPLAGLRLERAGASGRMWLCRHASHSERLLYSEDRRFIELLRQAGDSELQQQLDAALSAARRRTWLARSILLGLALVLVGGMWALFQGLSASVQLVPASVDARIGDYAFENMAERQLGGPVLRDADALLEPLQAMIDSMAVVLDDEFDYRLHLVDADVINAFALPGGTMVLYAGLAAKAPDPEAVAAVLAHEMAHVHHRHGLHRIARAAGITTAVALVFGDVSGVMALAVEILSVGSINAYSRDQEREADATGQRLLAAAGHDPMAMVTLLEVLARPEGDATVAAPGWMSTHPDTAERIASARQRAAALRIAPVEAPSVADWPAWQALLAHTSASIETAHETTPGIEHER